MDLFVIIYAAIGGAIYWYSISSAETEAEIKFAKIMAFPLCLVWPVSAIALALAVRLIDPDEL